MARSPGLGVSLIASVLGQSTSAALSLLVVPLYLRILGADAYGLIGLFASLTALAAVLDLGLTVTAMREVAREVQSPSPHRVRSILATLQAVYVAMGVAIAVIGVLAALWGGAEWLRSDALDPATVRLALAVFAATLGLRWPVALYAGALRGAERHVLLNGLIAAAAIVKHLGAVAVILWVAPTITAFVAWQAVAGAAELAGMSVAAWRALPPGPARFDRDVLTATWRFSTAVGATAILAAILKQLDRLVLSAVRPLAELGAYAAASALPNGFALVTAPVSQTALPRLSALAARGEHREAGEAFHVLTQIVAFTVSPAAAVLAWFAVDVLRLWTGSAAMAEEAALVLTLLSLALLLNAMMQVPYAMQLAYGHSWIGTITNGVGVLAVTPLMVLLVTRHGMVGGAVAWGLFNAGYYLIVPHVLARHVAAADRARFYLVDTLPFMVASLAGAGLLRALGPWLPAAAWWACGAGLALGYVAACLMCYSALRAAAARARAVLLQRPL